jgi:hypothetical protein
MTDAPALVLVPMDATEQIRRAVEAGNALYTGEAVWQKALSASPFIDGVPVEVVERCAIAMWADGWRDLDDWASRHDSVKEMFRTLARAALRAAGIKVADNG